MTQLKTLLSITLILVFGQIFSQNYAVIKNKNKFDIYKSGKKISSSFDDVKQFPGNYFGFKTKNKYGLLNPDGTIAIPNTFDEMLPFSDELFMVRKKDKWGLVSHQNRIRLSVEYDELKKHDDYLFKIKGSEGSGFINEQGVMLIPPIYEDINLFGDSKSMYEVKRKGKIGLINEIGENIIAAKYDTIYKLKNSNFCIGKLEGKQELINMVSRRTETISGNFSDTDISFDEIDMSYGTFFILKKGSQIGFYINNTLTPIVYDRIVFYQAPQGIIAVKQGDKYGLILKSGKVVEPIYDNITRFSGGRAFAEKNGRLLNINLEGEEINL